MISIQNERILSRNYTREFTQGMVSTTETWILWEAIELVEPVKCGSTKCWLHVCNWDNVLWGEKEGLETFVRRVIREGVYGQK